MWTKDSAWFGMQDREDVQFNYEEMDDESPDKYNDLDTN